MKLHWTVLFAALSACGTRSPLEDVDAAATDGAQADADTAGACVSFKLHDGEVPCQFNADCASDMYCPSCAPCTFYCVTRHPIQCGGFMVCGCDGTAFHDDCEAAKAGVGASPEQCPPAP
jgi:hypothetical protein